MRQSFHQASSILVKVLLSWAVGSVVVALAPASVQILASARADEIVYACGLQNGPSAIFSGYQTFGIRAVNYCGGNPNLWLLNDGVNTVPAGMSSGLVAWAPPGLVITQATVPSMFLQGTVGTGYVADFFWIGGQQRAVDTWTGYHVALSPPSSLFGFDLGCSSSGTTCPADGALVNMNNVQLVVQETVAPALTAIGSDNLWYKGPSEYVRGGGWSIAYSASAPSGIASMAASENGTPVTAPTPPGCVPIPTVWQQCPGTQTWSPTLSLNGAGAQELSLSALSAAQSAAYPTETIHVDTIQPTITLGGPTQAISTASTPYVTATAMVGPSGLGAITCSTDGGPAQSYSTSPASIPVSGLGMHSVSCTATNRSHDSAGQVAVSAPATWALDIAQPTVSGISFSSVVDSLRCKAVRERVTAPAKWVTIHRHGKPVWVQRRQRTRLVTAVKCHPVTVKRNVTVWVTEKRHGKAVLVKRRKVERVVLPSHLLSQATERVGHGRAATVSGWLGASTGIALPGRVVDVMTAPDNGLGQWTQAAPVVTGADGSWSANLPPGPSRLIAASYAGDSMTLPSTSSAVHLVVPAQVKLRTSPRSTRWGGTITITGRVMGGYIPAGKLLRLRIGVAGVRGTVGIPNIHRDGRFQTTWRFSAGSGVVHYWFSVSTLNEGDYPFAPASSRRVYVTVGPG